MWHKGMQRSIYFYNIMFRLREKLQARVTVYVISSILTYCPIDLVTPLTIYSIVQTGQMHEPSFTIRTLWQIVQYTSVRYCNHVDIFMR